MLNPRHTRERDDPNRPDNNYHEYELHSCC